MLIVAGDLHIGQAANLGRLPDQQRSWEALCIVAVDQGADVIGTGDWLHHRRPSPPEVDAFQAGLRILREGGRRFISALGNHECVDLDAVSCLETACAGFDARVIRGAEVVETVDGPVGFLPWTMGRGNARETTANLMTSAEALAFSGARILVGHFALSGGSLPSGLPNLTLTEPVLDSHRLGELFDVALMGHIHKPQIIVGEANEWPRVLHVGPLVRGNFGEADVRTGAWQLAPVSDGIGSSFLGATWFEVSDRTFLQVDVDARGLISPVGGILEILCEHEIEDAIVRVTYQVTAEQVVDTAAIVAYLEAEGAHRIESLTPIIERAASVRSQGVTEATDPRESWDRWADGQEIPDAIAETVRESAHERIGGPHA